MTGAPFPQGADAVVIVERTVADDGDATVSILAPAAPGDHVRPAGEDVERDQVVFPTGTVLGAGHVGVLTSIGATSVEVVTTPRAGVLSTGDELVEGGAPLEAGQIRDSNRPTLLSMLREDGFVAVDLGLVRDDEAQLRSALGGAVARCDALLTSGGVSMGEFDYVKKVLDELGDMRWMQVAIRPAKPLAFGVVEGMPVFGLPGNPVSSMVSYELFARPALRKMAGHPAESLGRPVVRAIADDSSLLRRPDDKLHLARVTVSWGTDGRYHMRSSGGQASNLLRSMALADGLALVPDGQGIPAGGEGDVMLLR
jgi:molybdenum cofactor synthesis domain-containing protein